MKIKFRPTKVVLIAFVFLLLYYPPILPINMMHVLTVISVLYLLRYRNKNISRILSGYSFPFFILSMYLLIVILLNGESISNVTPVLMLGIETVPVCLAIADMKTRKVSDVDIFDIIISAAMIQSLIAFATFFVPSLHELLINQYTNYGYGDIIIELSGYRMYGLSYGLTYGMPVANACIATIALYRGVNHDNKYFIKALLIFAAAVINARTSIVIFAIGLVGVVLSSIKDYKKAAKIVFYIVIALLLFSQVLVYLDSYAPETAEWIRHGIEDITTFITGKDSNEYSYFSYATSKSKYSVPSVCPPRKNRQ